MPKFIHDIDSKGVPQKQGYCVGFCRNRVGHTTNIDHVSIERLDTRSKICKKSMHSNDADIFLSYFLSDMRVDDFIEIDVY